MNWRLAAACAAALCSATATANAADGDAAIARWVRQLDDESVEVRDAAERALLSAAADSRQIAVLRRTVPLPDDAMSADLRSRLTRVRRAAGDPVPSLPPAASRVTLQVRDAPLPEILAELTRQTGNQVEDARAQFGQDDEPLRASLEAADVPFWEAADRLCDAIRLEPSPFGGAGRLALIRRPNAAPLRSDKAAYVGPFRIAATAISARRDFRNPEQSQVHVDLEFAWEPRWQPIAIAHPASGMRAFLADGLELPLFSPDASFDVDVQAGARTAELSFPFRLPSRDDAEIDRLVGGFSVLSPGDRSEFEFADLQAARPQSQTRSGVTVTLHRVRRSGELWELHMRIAVAGDQGALASHRGWVFQNPAVLRGPTGEEIDHVGWETTLHADREAGVAYLYEVPGDLTGFAWIYRTPSAFQRTAFSYELRGLTLP